MHWGLENLAHILSYVLPPPHSLDMFSAPHTPHYLEMHTLPGLHLPISALYIENKLLSSRGGNQIALTSRERCVFCCCHCPCWNLDMSMGRVSVRGSPLWGISVQGKVVAGSSIAQLG